MTTLDRREYLKLMSAAALISLGEACAPSGGPAGPAADRSDGSNATAKAVASSHKPLTWPESWTAPFPNYPADQNIRLVFYGLGSFSPGQEAGKPSCEVGFLSGKHGPHSHKLQVYAYEDCTKILDSNTLSQPVTDIRLTVPPADAVLDRVYFFQPGDFEEHADLYDPRDFRWLIDLESDYLYRNYPYSSNPNKLRKKSGIYTAKFVVTNGLFYTLRKTSSKFKVQPKNSADVRYLGNVADVIGANVYVGSKKTVKLSVNGTEKDLTAPGEIIFLNMCVDDSDKPCKFNPGGAVKELRNDFYLHYSAIDLEGKPEFELILDEAHEPAPYPDVCLDKVWASDEKGIRSTDEAPCSFAGYGGGYP